MTSDDSSSDEYKSCTENLESDDNDSDTQKKTMRAILILQKNSQKH